MNLYKCRGTVYGALQLGATARAAMSHAIVCSAHGTGQVVDASPIYK